MSLQKTGGIYHFWIPCGTSGEYSHWQLVRQTAAGDYRLFGPTIEDAVGGSAVEVLCSQASEVELVYNREENPGTNDDTQGGHGNVSLTSISFVVDGVDVSSTVEAGTLVTGWRISVSQPTVAWSDEPGQPDIFKVGDNQLTHYFADGGIYDASTIAPILVTTIYPWGYSGMNVGDLGAFDGYWALVNGVETYGTLATGQTSLGRASGCRFVSSSHDYGLGMMQIAPLEANFNWENSASESFILSVVADTKWKFYIQASAGTNPKVLQPGDVWSSMNFRYAIPV